MRKAAIGVYSLVIAAAAAFVVFTPPPFSVQAASAPESEEKQITENIQTFQAGDYEVTPLDRGSYTATTPEELEAIQQAKRDEEAKAAAEEAAAKKAPQLASVGPTPTYTGGGTPAEWMAAAGIPESDWGYVDYIVSKESGWNPNAVNKSSGASGLVQALPCGKVPGDCFNPVDNLRWADGYAKGRYGSWAGAYNFWVSNNWW